jgi:hypothetical protein
MKSPIESTKNQPKQDQPKRISRWENLQRAMALGENHPNPRFRLLHKALKEQEEQEEQEQKEQREQVEQGHSWEYEIMI